MKVSNSLANTHAPGGNLPKSSNTATLAAQFEKVKAGQGSAPRSLEQRRLSVLMRMQDHNLFIKWVPLPPTMQSLDNPQRKFELYRYSDKWLFLASAAEKDSREANLKVMDEKELELAEREVEGLIKEISEEMAKYKQTTLGSIDVAVTKGLSLFWNGCQDPDDL